MATKDQTAAFAAALHSVIDRVGFHSEGAANEAHEAVDNYLGTGVEAPKAEK